jgi:hypothetical protein
MAPPRMDGGGPWGDAIDFSGARDGMPAALHGISKFPGVPYFDGSGYFDGSTSALLTSACMR